eukprot:Rhum_TRINITY_DN10926_c0_g1::Rhum_TRINITY_DN10926_c0_g1_i1::g.41092::m.41092
MLRLLWEGLCGMWGEGDSFVMVMNAHRYLKLGSLCLVEGVAEHNVHEQLAAEGGELVEVDATTVLHVHECEGLVRHLGRRRVAPQALRDPVHDRHRQRVRHHLAAARNVALVARREHQGAPHVGARLHRKHVVGAEAFAELGGTEVADVLHAVALRIFAHAVHPHAELVLVRRLDLQLDAAEALAVHTLLLLLHLPVPRPRLLPAVLRLHVLEQLLLPLLDELLVRHHPDRQLHALERVSTRPDGKQEVAARHDRPRAHRVPHLRDQIPRLEPGPRRRAAFDELRDDDRRLGVLLRRPAHLDLQRPLRAERHLDAPPVALEVPAPARFLLLNHVAVALLRPLDVLHRPAHVRRPVHVQQLPLQQRKLCGLPLDGRLQRRDVVVLLVEQVDVDVLLHLLLQLADLRQQHRLLVLGQPRRLRLLRRLPQPLALLAQLLRLALARVLRGLPRLRQRRQLARQPGRRLLRLAALRLQRALPRGRRHRLLLALQGARALLAQVPRQTLRLRLALRAQLLRGRQRLAQPQLAVLRRARERLLLLLQRPHPRRQLRRLLLEADSPRPLLLQLLRLPPCARARRLVQRLVASLRLRLLAPLPLRPRALHLVDPLLHLRLRLAHSLLLLPLRLHHALRRLVLPLRHAGRVCVLQPPPLVALLLHQRGVLAHRRRLLRREPRRRLLLRRPQRRLRRLRLLLRGTLPLAQPRRRLLLRRPLRRLRRARFLLRRRELLARARL